MSSFAMSCFSVVLVPAASERTGFPLQQVSRERGHALFLLVQALLVLSHASSFTNGLVALLIKKKIIV